jgi:methanogenic corrinoid protein MtbC1
MIMSLLYPRIFRTKRNGRSLVSACVSSELHELGARMVADFFEMEGWDTYYLGANAPAKSIIEAIEFRQADILAISATMISNIRATEQLLQEIRASEAGKKIKILVGGYPFNVSPNLWQKLGADAYASNALDAVTKASTLLT